MKIGKSKRSNIIFLILLMLFFVPQIRQPVQIFVQKGVALISPSILKSHKQKRLVNYNWELQTEQKTMVNFNTLKGKVVLVNFWATWCPPCIAEMPSLQKLYNDYCDSIEFIFVPEESFKTTHIFLEKNGYTFPVYKKLSQPQFFNVKSIPRTFLIDKKGQVIIDKIGAANWNSKTVRQTIDNLLKKDTL